MGLILRYVVVQGILWNVKGDLHWFSNIANDLPFYKIQSVSKESYR